MKATNEYATQASEMLQEKVPEAIQGLSIEIGEKSHDHFLFQLAKNLQPKQSKPVKNTAKKHLKKPKNMLKKCTKPAKTKPKNFSKKQRRRSIYKRKHSSFNLHLITSPVKFLLLSQKKDNHHRLVVQIRADAMLVFLLYI